MNIQDVENGNFYHIYNRGINSCKIFNEKDNYVYFLNLVRKYVYPIAEFYAYALMSNHFHFLIKVRDESEYIIKQPKNRVITSEDISPSRQLSHLFNAYAQAFNKMYSRTGGLFESPFKRKLIVDEEYLIKLILYINNNPKHHNIVDRLDKYSWSSYNSILSEKDTLLEREKIINLFENKKNFIDSHNNAEYLLRNTMFGF